MMIYPGQRLHPSTQRQCASKTKSSRERFDDGNQCNDIDYGECDDDDEFRTSMKEYLNTLIPIFLWGHFEMPPPRILLLLILQVFNPSHIPLYAVSCPVSWDVTSKRCHPRLASDDALEWHFWLLGCNMFVGPHLSTFPSLRDVHCADHILQKLSPLTCLLTRVLWYSQVLAPQRASLISLTNLGDISVSFGNPCMGVCWQRWCPKTASN